MDINKPNSKILIVDDEPNMRFTLQDILEDEGYEITTAANGNEAVTYCEKYHFDLVLMDVRMPGLTGVEAFRLIRQHKENMKIILMSAYAIDELKHTALDEGAIAFLPKPLNLQKTIQLIKDVNETAILVVEKDEEVTTSLVDSLKEHGYKVTSTQSPFDALELVEQIKFNLVLVDVNLPSMNGLDLYLAIKKITPSSIAIMLTGFEEESVHIAKQAVSKNAYTFIHKPINIERTIDLIKRMTQKKASGDNRKPNTN